MKYDVSVVKDESNNYYCKAPFSPSQMFPEFNGLFRDVDKDNKIYSSIRKMFINLGLDKNNCGTLRWNPLSDFIKPGNTVLIKPNLVLDNNGGSNNIEAVVTHAAVIRPIIDYVLLALRGNGRIIVADAPQANADFEKIIMRNGLAELIKFYKDNNINIDLYDLRKNVYIGGFETGIRKVLSGDPAGYVLCNLEKNSYLQDARNLDRLYGADYDRTFIVKQHTNAHKYLFSKSVLNADVIISVPKMKTHRKAGVTLNSKNMVGVNGDKNYLAHFRVGSPSEGGDEYPDNVSFCGKIYYKWFRFASDYILIRNTKCSRIVFKWLNFPFRVVHYGMKILNKDYFMGHGDWHGNDTVWRMCLDLNMILLFCDKNAQLRTELQRKYFCVVDGIVAGEGDGPLEPSPKRVGYLACGNNPFLVDYVCAYQMGFIPEKVPVILETIKSKWFGYDPSNITVTCMENNKKIDFKEVNMHFAAQDNWKGHIER